MGTLGNNDWYTSNVTVTWEVVDEESEITEATGCEETTIDFDTSGETLTCEATSAGGTASESVTIKRDATPPTISATLDRAPADSGWFNSFTGAPSPQYTCSDATSGIASCPTSHTFGEGIGQSHNGTAYDNAGNSESAGVSDVDVDLTPPGIVWNGDIEDGAEFYFGSVPGAPTCAATDDLSGPAGCTVSGYATTVGNHELTATAYDVAGNKTEETRSYTVLAWTLTGFYQPVKMDALNTVRGGSTVPLKFNVYAGDTELKDNSIVSFVAQPFACGGETGEEIEFATSGNTSLRYDATEGQFIQNWKTPRSPGSCYKVIMTTLDDSTIEAVFELR
jgi:hypothetical protein